MQSLGAVQSRAASGARWGGVHHEHPIELRCGADIPVVQILVKADGVLERALQELHVAHIPSAQLLVKEQGVIEHVFHARHLAEIPCVDVSVELLGYGVAAIAYHIRLRVTAEEVAHVVDAGRVPGGDVTVHAGGARCVGRPLVHGALQLRLGGEDAHRYLCADAQRSRSVSSKSGQFGGMTPGKHALYVR